MFSFDKKQPPPSPARAPTPKATNSDSPQAATLGERSSGADALGARFRRRLLLGAAPP